MIRAVFAIAFLMTNVLYCDAAISKWTSPDISVPKGAGEVTIPELKKGQTSVTIAATGTGTLTYAIIKQPVTGLFTIVATGNDAGKITVTKALDYETTKSYIIEVTATDSTETDKSATATATVTVKVTNVGPIFATSSQQKCVEIGTAAETKITTIDAKLEKGETGTITYDSIKEGATASETFSLNPTSGDVKVSTGKTLNAAKTYNCTIEVSDGSEKDTMDLKIIVGECSSASFTFISQQSIMIMLILVIAF